MAFSIFLGSGVTHQVTRTLTAAQVRALPTSAIELVAAPGANKILCVQFAALFLNWVANFTTIDGTAQLLIVNGITNLVQKLDESVNSAVSSLLAGGESSSAFIPGWDANTSGARIFGFSGWVGTDVVNQALNLSATNGSAGNFTVGTGSTLTVGVTYLVFNTVTGQFE